MKPAAKTVPWLTADEARQHLGLKTMNAFYVFCHRYRPKTHYLGRRPRFRQTDLDKCVTSTPEPVKRETEPTMRLVKGTR